MHAAPAGESGLRSEGAGRSPPERARRWLSDARPSYCSCDPPPTWPLLRAAVLQVVVAKMEALQSEFGDHWAPPKLLVDMAAKGELFHKAE